MTDSWAYEDSLYLINNWTEHLLLKEPQSDSDAKIQLAQRAYEAHQILKLLLSKSYDNGMCENENPNKKSLEQFVNLLTALIEYYHQNNLAALMSS